MSNQAQVTADAQQQKAISALPPLYVAACPGAGKTHVIASRHLALPAGRLRQGRALLSFTRTAGEQMAERCRAEGRPEMTGFPHHVGTLDSFLWEFLVRPWLAADRSWRLFDSWSAHRTQVKISKWTLPLDAFTFEYDPESDRESVSYHKLEHSAKSTVDASGYSWPRWKQAVLQERNSLAKLGDLTCHESRICALRNLRNRTDEVLVPLRSRFTEIMVDEVQDCSTVELAILEILHDAGLMLTMVGDPDQMIYGWRDADPVRLNMLTSKLGTRVDLTGNRRSTPTICGLAATLRTGNRPADLSVANHQDDLPILLLPTRFGTGTHALHVPSESDSVTVFRDQAEAVGIPVSDCLVTARARKRLPLPPRQQGGNMITRLARAHEVVASGTSNPSQLDQACRVAALLLLGYWYPDSASSPEAICRVHQLAMRDVYRQAYAFLHQLPAPNRDWRSEVNSLLRKWPRPTNAAPRNGKGLVAGSPGLPAKHNDLTGIRPRMDNIHQVKGDEAEAVLILLPDEGIASRWLNGDPHDDEELRILYVAVTRARRLLGLAVTESEVDAIAGLLDQFTVPYRLV
ncbi:UvrD-helicase domain-containing protein [Actinomadura kijaniata]|uniref:UvrD-helicase domain-containing protein n=1 Tax=Actinomadura kijaniata TaxID=46161 RepID=UPI003F1D2BF2